MGTNSENRAIQMEWGHWSKGLKEIGQLDLCHPSMQPLGSVLRAHCVWGRGRAASELSPT